MKRFQFQARPGMNLIEVLVAAVVAGVVMLALGGYITANLSGNMKEKDRTFANQKALQLLEEMSSEDLATNQLGPDKYQKENFSFRLTTQNVTPHSPLSGNIQRGAVYKFVRRVESSPVAGDPLSRKVTVKVYYQDGNVNVPQPMGKPLAVVTGVLRSLVASVGAKQVIDVYAISIENIPHLYRKDSNQVATSTTDARGSFEASLNAVRLANPGLEFRLHYISRLSVGRDNKYKPYVNEYLPITGSGRENIEWGYFYPGKLSAQSPKRYLDFAGMRGQLRINTTALATPSTTGYPMADQYNHAVRYHDEFTAAGVPILPAGETSLSLRQLLEEMLEDATDKYRNAVVVNLHGEMLPVIPLRSYADAAKDTTDDSANGSARRRVVTHPYKLSFATGGLTAEHVKLLVHGYNSDGSNDPGYDPFAKCVRVVVKDVVPDLDISGGSNTGAWDAQDITRYRYAFTPGGGPNSSWTVTNNAGTPTIVGNDLIIEFDDMGYDARYAAQGGGSLEWGLGPAPDGRLYNLQYFPDPYLNFLSAQQLGNFSPRNTAKFVIEFPLKTTTASDRYQVITQIKKKAIATTTAPYPPLASKDAASSRTTFYLHKTWNPAKGKFDGIPWTDQVQLTGDPRHVPYLDARRNGLYNKYWTDFTASKEVYKGLFSNSSDYSKYLNADDVNGGAGFTTSEDADSGTGKAYSAAYPGTSSDWNDVKADIPTYLTMWREALLRNNALFMNMSGEPIRYIGMGGEFSINGPIYDYDVDMSENPWNPGNSGDAGSNADEIFGDHTAYLEKTDDTWASLPWIGELYPYTAREDWDLYGNVKYGTGSSNVKRRSIEDIEVWDKFAHKTNGSHQKRIENQAGFSMFLNGLKSGSSTPLDLRVGGGSDKGTVDAAGSAAFQALRLAPPKESRTSYAYKLDGGSPPTGWGAPGPYASPGLLEWLHSAPSPGPYYKGQNSGEYTVYPIVLTKGPNKAYFLANTFRPERASDLSNIMQIGTASLVATFFDATKQSLLTNNFKPQPRTKVIKPKTDQILTANSVALEWYARFIKTDGGNYSPFSTFDPLQPINNGGPLDTAFFFKYRNLTTNGPWMTAKVAWTTGTPGSTAEVSSVAYPTAEAGLVPVAPGVNPAPISTITAGPPPYAKMEGSWDITGFPNGDYLLRVEGYRRSGSNVIPIHYAYHEIPVKISR